MNPSGGLKLELKGVIEKFFMNRLIYRYPLILMAVFHQKVPLRPFALPLGVILILLGYSHSLAVAQAVPRPFFLMGDGRVHIKNVRTGLEARVELLLPDGALNERAIEAIDAVFGFSPQEEGDHISPRLIFMLNYFSNLVASNRTIFLTSGYRSPEYNAGLKKAGGIVAKTSTHMDGLALDFYIEGIKGKALWEIIRQKNCCGVGHYGGKEIHLDAGRPRFWEAATSKVDTNESDYNRRMFLSSDLDRYRPGQTLRLSLYSVSDFGFGIARKAFLMPLSEENHSPTELTLQTGEESSDCLFIKDRRASRFITLTLPQNIKEGHYRIRLDFCQRPFEQMPLTNLSNEVEILPSEK
jgi:uncharacterized protein YcbK (DUF882 family)